jgi:FkbM family methyltransferase
MMFRSFIVNFAHSALKAGVRIPEMPGIRRFSEQAFLCDLLKDLRINCFLDVGANKGIYSKHLRMMGYDGYIFSFEPIGEDFEAVSLLARGDSLWQSFNYALGSENTKRSFNIIKISADKTQYSSFLRPIDTPIERTEIVEIKRLDSILADLTHQIVEPRIFLKVDTQGYDLEVVKGAEGFWGRLLGIYSEISVTPIYDGMPHYTKVLEYYESLGFSLMNLFVVSRTSHQSIIEYDCVMARLEQLIS